MMKKLALRLACFCPAAFNCSCHFDSSGNTGWEHIPHSNRRRLSEQRKGPPLPADGNNCAEALTCQPSYWRTSCPAPLPTDAAMMPAPELKPRASQQDSMHHHLIWRFKAEHYSARASCATRHTSRRTVDRNIR